VPSVRQMSVDRQCEDLLLRQADGIVRRLASARAIEVVNVRQGGNPHDPTVEVVVRLTVPGSEPVTAGFLSHVWYGDDHDGELDNPEGVTADNAAPFVDFWSRVAFQPRAESALEELERLASQGRLSGSLPMLEYGVHGAENGPLLRDHPAR
jgi:hypothetical protein